MTISETSRYARGVTAWVEHPTQGLVQVVHRRPVYWVNYPFVEYQANSSDSLPLLAHEQYGNAKDYWFIADMNPHIQSPDDLSAGALLRVPTKKTL